MERNTPRRRCPASKMKLVDLPEDKGDPFHHYTARCPECGKGFYLPYISLPIHYVEVVA